MHFDGSRAVAKWMLAAFLHEKSYTLFDDHFPHTREAYRSAIAHDAVDHYDWRESFHGTTLTFRDELLVHVQGRGGSAVAQERLCVFDVCSCHFEPGREAAAEDLPVHEAQAELSGCGFEVFAQDVVIPQWSLALECLEDEVLWAIALDWRVATGIRSSFSPSVARMENTRPRRPPRNSGQDGKKKISTRRISTRSRTRLSAMQ